VLSLIVLLSLAQKMQTATLIRIDRKLLGEFQKICKEKDISFNKAINNYIESVVNGGGQFLPLMAKTTHHAHIIVEMEDLRTRLSIIEARLNIDPNENALEPVLSNNKIETPLDSEINDFRADSVGAIPDDLKNGLTGNQLAERLGVTGGMVSTKSKDSDFSVWARRKEREIRSINLGWVRDKKEGDKKEKYFPII
jgi:hypothetical protein